MKIEKETKKSIQKTEKEIYKKQVLVISDLDKKIRIKVNTLNYVTKEMLSMKCKDKRQRLITYLLKSQ